MGLEAELKATRANMRLLAQSKGIKPNELTDYLLAMEINADQLHTAEDEANGEQLVTAPSGSNTRPEPVLRQVKKKNNSTSATSASGNKPTAKATPKLERIPKKAPWTPKSGPKKERSRGMRG